VGLYAKVDGNFRQLLENAGHQVESVHNLRWAALTEGSVTEARYSLVSSHQFTSCISSFTEPFS
jgi:hypothetical protein